MVQIFRCLTDIPVNIQFQMFSKISYINSIQRKLMDCATVYAVTIYYETDTTTFFKGERIACRHICQGIDTKLIFPHVKDLLILKFKLHPALSVMTNIQNIPIYHWLSKCV